MRLVLMFSRCVVMTLVVCALFVQESVLSRVIWWLDLANAYGSIPHKLVFETLERHHVPAKVRVLNLEYYGDFCPVNNVDLEEQLQLQHQQ